MVNKKDYNEIRRLKMSANPAKERLVDIVSRIEESGAIGEAKSLKTIIWRLEVWQNK